MDAIGLNQNMDIEFLLTQLQREASRGDEEGIKIEGVRIHAHAERIQDKRQEQLENIKRRLKGAHPNACLKFFATVFKVFDLLLKPLSAITGGQLKLELGKALEMLKQAQLNGRLMGIDIDGEQIKGAIQELKNLLQQDMERISNQQDRSETQNQQILKILDALEQGFESTENI
jgi:hypothetical protein